MGETEMVSFGYSAVAYILLVPWLYGPLTASLTHCGRVTQIYVFKTVKLGTSASSP